MFITDKTKSPMTHEQVGAMVEEIAQIPPAQATHFFNSALASLRYYEKEMKKGRVLYKQEADKVEKYLLCARAFKATGSLNRELIP